MISGFHDSYTNRGFPYQPNTSSSSSSTSCPPNDEVCKKHVKERCNLTMLPVFIIQSKHDTVEKSEKVAQHFASDFFIIHIMQIDIPADLYISQEMNSREDAEHAHIWQKTLEHSKSLYPKSPVLIVSSHITTNLESSQIENMIKSSLCYCDDDLIYLSDYMDNCKLFEDPIRIHAATVLLKTYAPNGLDAILFSSNGRDIVLGDKVMQNGRPFTPVFKPLSDQLRECISNSDISARVCFPTIFNYDIGGDNTNSNVLRANVCSHIIKEKTKNNNNAIPAFWFLIIVIIIVVLGWLAVRFSNQKEKKEII